MQVSWIDADRIKALVAQIAPLEACVQDTPRILELDTTPEPLPGTDPESWGFTMDWVEPAVRPAPAPHKMMEFPAESARTDPPVQTEEEGEYSEQEPPHQHSAAALPLSRIRDKLRAIRQRASAAGILTRGSEPAPREPTSNLPMTEAALFGQRGHDAMAAVNTNIAATKRESGLPQAPAFEVPLGPRDVRLAAFASWSRQVLHEDGGHVLVMSDEGEVLWGGEAKAGLVLSTMMAWGAAIRASAMSACDGVPKVIHQPLASGNVLTVIPCEAAGGMVHAAVAAPAGLTPEQAQLIREALCAAMN